MTTSASKKADRIFVKNGRRHYRRKFSATETRVGIVVLLVLASILVWVAWRGAHPDASLFMLETDLSQAGAAGAAAVVDRGPLPSALASAGWSEGEFSRFDYDNLFVKINGREGYYKSFGFEMLYFLSIVLSEDAQTVVDIEIYDLGNAANAVGAYSGERSPDATPEVGDSGLMHFDRNALYLTRGRFYLRAIGSEESPAVRAQLEHVKTRFEQELPGEPLPWGYALFVGRMGMEPGAVSYASENAFSFGFARNVYSAKLEDGGELFVTPTGSESNARDLVDQFKNGFRRYGTDEGDFIKDRYLGAYATVTAAGPWVVGILRAPETGAARAAVDELAAVVRAMPLPAIDVAPPPAEDSVDDSIDEGYGDDEY